MSFPQSFSTTAECPFMTSTPSTVTVKLSSATPTGSRSGTIPHSLSVTGSRVRAKTDPLVPSSPSLSSPRPPNAYSTPPNSFSRSESRTSVIKTLLQRSRSRTVPDSRQLPPIMRAKSPAQGSTSWWNPTNVSRRPWDEDAEGSSVPTEQKRVFVQTRDAVLYTLKRVCGLVIPITMEMLETGLELLEISPIPALQTIARTLVNIWRAVEQVGINRLAILRITQTCTTILDSIYVELAERCNLVASDLEEPLATLERSFEDFLFCVQRQVETPFLMKYLRRDQITREIIFCRKSIGEALDNFKTTVQLRTFDAVIAISHSVSSHECSRERFQSLVIPGQDDQKQGGVCSESRCPSRSSIGLRTSSSSSIEPMSPSLSSTERTFPSLLQRMSSTSRLSHLSSVSRLSRTSFRMPSAINVLTDIQSTQNEEDARCDREDLRQLLRSALQSGSDAEMFHRLEIVLEELPEALKTLQRTLESESSQKDELEKDTLHREFIESGIDVLRRMSTGVDTNLPTWTITKFEITRDRSIGYTHFSRVYQGTWKGRTVAIKVLSDATPQKVFLREMNVWKTINHPNVLPLLGASSATVEPPWYFVSPYLKHGTLIEFMKRISVHREDELGDLGPILKNLTMATSRSNYSRTLKRRLVAGHTYRILQEVAKGMEYLHENEILHGDLKAANVLVDDNYRCVIADFGQSEMKSEVFRITGVSRFDGGTLRWKAPELLDGSGVLTQATDVYAYAMLCIEVLEMGELPWGLTDDETVRYCVLELNKRPAIPVEVTSPLLQVMITGCWSKEPEKRPSFTEIIRKLQSLRDADGGESDPLVLINDLDMPEEADYTPMSPQMSPTCFSPTWTYSSGMLSDGSGSYRNPSNLFSVCSDEEVSTLNMEETVPNGCMKMPEPVHYVAEKPETATDTLSVYADTTASESLADLGQPNKGRESPPPSNQRSADARNERRYRLLLEHTFHPSLTLPLWNPVSVELGDVGYLSKPGGTFVTLFNAFKPHKTSGGLTGGMPSLAGYGKVSKGNHRQDKRSVAQKGFDAVSGFLTFTSRSDVPISRRQSFVLRAGHKCAHMYTESAEYQYIKVLKAPKAWFQANVELILHIYGRDHNIHKEDLFLIIGALQVRDYALFVSHRHPDGQAHFNVFSNQKKGHPWGTYTTDTNMPNGCSGPRYDEPMREEQDCANKISLVGDPLKAVLVGRLRFKPDAMEPTSL
ncbi:hypothetical protein B0H34DRAFT_80502 [Crassisporium funariophilum]|nr:hypothetical protein B0H34DRAFT_80502 [Crassisporium funariophilum]